MLRFYLTHQLALALFQLGDDVGEVGDDAFGVFVGVEQVIHLAVLGKSRQRVEGVARIAVAGAGVAAISLGQ